MSMEAGIEILVPMSGEGGQMVKWCLFHKNQSLLKKAREEKLTQRLVGNVKVCYERLCVMPYLEPASMVQALDAIENAPAPVRCQGLIDGLVTASPTYYVGDAVTRPRFTPDEWSVYSCTMNDKPRTNNAQESFHAKFNETANCDNLAGRKVLMSKSIATLKIEEENARQLYLASSIQSPVVRGARRTAAQQRNDSTKTALGSGNTLLKILDDIIIATRN